MAADRDRRKDRDVLGALPSAGREAHGRLADGDFPGIGQIEQLFEKTSGTSRVETVLGGRCSGSLPPLKVSDGRGGAKRPCTGTWGALQGSK